jgi:hypothetical protein
MINLALLSSSTESLESPPFSMKAAQSWGDFSEKLQLEAGSVTSQPPEAWLYDLDFYCHARSHMANLGFRVD